MILWEGDTLVAITQEQEKALNIELEHKDYLQELNDSLKITTGKLKVALIDCRELGDKLNKSMKDTKYLSKGQAAFIKQLRADAVEKNIKIDWLKKINRYLWISSGTLLILLILLV